jgi:two-component system sensor histidine kinase HydH
MSERPMRSRAFARYGLLGVALCMGLALVASTLLGYSRAREHARALSEEQARGVMSSLSLRFDPERGPPTRDELQGLLASESEFGLRYLAVLDGRGNVSASAGSPVSPGGRPPLPGQLEMRGGRVRFVAPPPAPPAGPHAGPPPPLAPPPPGGGPPPPGGPGFALLVEMEPLLAERLIADAARSLWLGIATAVLFGVVALVAFRLSAEREARERELLKQRHLATLGEMSGVLAHEIKNPLAIAKGHAQLLAEKVAEDERQSRWIAEVVGSLERLESLVGDLLELAKSGEIHRASVSPLELAKRAIAEVDGGEIELVDRGAPASWSLDARHFGSVLGNLLRNAVQASAGEPVTVEIGRSGASLFLSVRDRGPGIPSGEEERIFEAFHTTRTRGVGLGLAIARRIVHLHGGRIEASNHPDGGALFRVIVPGD